MFAPSAGVVMLTVGGGGELTVIVIGAETLRAPAESCANATTE
jgi:hypothetical protein